MRICAACDAGLWRRVAGIALDLVIAAAGFAMLNVVLVKSGLVAGADVTHQVRALRALWLQPQGLALLVVACAAATVLAWRVLGGTPGAQLVGVRVCRARDGGRPGVTRAALRLAVAWTLLGLGLLWSLGGRRALHDRICGTRAVLEDEALLELPGRRAQGA